MTDGLFGDIVTVGLMTGVVVGVEKKRKWTYYDVVFKDAQQSFDDWERLVIVYEIIREDQLNDWKGLI